MLDPNTPLSELRVGDIRQLFLEILDYREILAKGGRKPLKGRIAIANSLGITKEMLDRLRSEGVFYGVVLQPEGSRTITSYEDELQARYAEYSSGRYKPLSHSQRKGIL